MLAPPNDFGYSPSHAHTMASYDQQHQHGIQHQHSGERPKIYGLDQHQSMHNMHHGMNEFQQMVNGTPHHGMTPQHHNPGEFDHEPLMLNMQHQNHFYPQLNAHMLHVSADYGSGGSVGNGTPSSSKTPGGTKRSREELNLKEKKRMFKLNDRITELKAILDEAGVQCKKNKQSILDNTHHYIGMIRSNLLIAKQKAERAEKQAEMFRQQALKNSGSGVDLVYRRCFEQSATPRIILDLNMEILACNTSFLNHTGETDESLKNKEALRGCLCVDNSKLDAIIKSVVDGSKALTSIVQARSSSGVSTVTLMASVMTDNDGKPHSIEFSLIPFEISSDLPQQTFQEILVKGEGEESSPSSVAELAL